MPGSKHYTLTRLADKDLVELKTWSRSRWGRELTRRYMADIDAGAERIAKNYKTLRSRDDLAAQTGLSILPVREHYLIFHPVDRQRIVIVAVIRQGRDVPAILAGNYARIARELKEIMASYADNG